MKLVIRFFYALKSISIKLKKILFSDSLKKEFVFGKHEPKANEIDFIYQKAKLYSVLAILIALLSVVLNLKLLELI